MHEKGIWTHPFIQGIGCIPRCSAHVENNHSEKTVSFRINVAWLIKQTKDSKEETKEFLIEMGLRHRITTKDLTEWLIDSRDEKPDLKVLLQKKGFHLKSFTHVQIKN